MLMLPSVKGVMAVRLEVLVKLTEIVPPAATVPLDGRYINMLRLAFIVPIGNSGRELGEKVVMLEVENQRDNVPLYNQPAFDALCVNVPKLDVLEPKVIV